MSLNKCQNCGCEDALVSPAPCPTPAGCPDPQPCSEVFDAQCIIYTGDVLTSGITVEEAIDELATPAYRVYTALLTQTGTNAPVATILENTLGFVPSWTRTAAGTYKITNASFQLNKTIVNNLNPWGDGLAITNVNVEPKLAFIAAGPVYVDVRLATNLSSSNTIEINTFNSSSAKTDGIISSYAVFLEIRLYN